jgi:putative FmdB family regulatory protein
VPPTYEEACSTCKEMWEEFAGITDPVQDKCPKCGTKGAVVRLISGCNFRLVDGGVNWGDTGYQPAMPEVLIDKG